MRSKWTPSVVVGYGDDATGRAPPTRSPTAITHHLEGPKRAYEGKPEAAGGMPGWVAPGPRLVVRPVVGKAAIQDSQ